MAVSSTRRLAANATANCKLSEMASVHAIPSLDEQYEFTAESKRRLIIGGVVGVALVALGAVLLSAGVGEHAHEAVQGQGLSEGHEGAHGHYSWLTRVWANV